MKGGKIITTSLWKGQANPIFMTMIHNIQDLASLVPSALCSVVIDSICL